MAHYQETPLGPFAAAGIGSRETILGLLSQRLGGMEEEIRSFRDECARLWWESEAEFPSLPRRYDFRSQKAVERDLLGFVDRIAGRLEPGRRESDVVDSLVEELRSFGQSFLDLAEGEVDTVFRREFVDSTRAFLDRAVEFDPQLSIEDAYQALRNVWIMNTLQVYLGREIRCTDAVFAYSLIYPYTDNVLDSGSETAGSKLGLGVKLRRWLEGRDEEAESAGDERVRRLVRLIESQYPRDEFPGVYGSLLGIFNAQMRSLFQQSRSSYPYEMDILGISLEKGGTSVLADGYLVGGRLNPREADFCFGFGAFLQLADDIQDTKADRRGDHMTLFSQTAGRFPLDRLAGKLFGFMSRIVEEKLSSDRPSEAALRNVILKNAVWLVLEAVGRNREYFSRSYAARAQKHFPVRFSFRRRLRRKLEKSLLRRRKTVADLDVTTAVLLTAASRVLSQR